MSCQSFAGLLHSRFKQSSHSNSLIRTSRPLLVHLTASAWSAGSLPSQPRANGVSSMLTPAGLAAARTAARSLVSGSRATAYDDEVCSGLALTSLWLL